MFGLYYLMFAIIIVVVLNFYSNSDLTLNDAVFFIIWGPIIFIAFVIWCLTELAEKFINSIKKWFEDVI